jgi:hypothetical protein
VAHDAKEIQKAIQVHLGNGRYESEPIYGAGQAGKRIADLLATTELKVAKQISY